MSRFLPVRLISFLLLLTFSFNLLTLPLVYSQIKEPQGKFKVEITATVGDFYLDLSGWISPFASVVMTSGGVFIRATVADQGGNFSISQILVRRGFSDFCLEAVDFKRLGTSITCFNIPPVNGPTEMREIFLPPTLGLYRSEIAVGEKGIAFGYTMPGAEVTLNLSNGLKLTTRADSAGYYIFNIENLSAGTYQLFATAKYNDKQSLQPSKKLTLKALSLWDRFIKFLQDLWKKIIEFFTSFALGPLWIGLPILILIIILILKIWPDKFSFIYQSRFIIFFSKHFGKRRKLLHHYYFEGF